jgi:hypothetical protein
MINHCLKIILVLCLLVTPAFAASTTQRDAPTVTSESMAAPAAAEERGTMQEQATCAAQAKKVATKDDFKTWVSHYNPKERRCYVLEAEHSIWVNPPKNDDPKNWDSASFYLLDAFEGHEYFRLVCRAGNCVDPMTIGIGPATGSLDYHETMKYLRERMGASFELPDPEVTWVNDPFRPNSTP